MVEMSCYYPLIGVPTGDYWPSGKPKFHFIGGSADMYEFLKLKDPRTVFIPCGKCLGCRLDYSRKWADRMMMEYDVQKKAVFLTLTYDDDHVPIEVAEDTGEYLGMTLRKCHMQFFLKRLRREFEPRRLRFYGAGEYGESTYRPHMHLIIFGIDLDDFADKTIQGRNDLKQPYFVSPIIDKLWPLGYHMLCDVSYQTCDYVARYTAKKCTSSFVPSDIGLEPEFALMSRNPGIGVPYLNAHPDLFDHGKIQLPDGRKASIPRLFKEKSGIDRIEDKAEVYAETMWNKNYRDDVSTLDLIDQLAVDEQVRRQSIKALSRKAVK